MARTDIKSSGLCRCLEVLLERNVNINEIQIKKLKDERNTHVQRITQIDKEIEQIEFQSKQKSEFEYSH